MCVCVRAHVGMGVGCVWVGKCVRASVRACVCGLAEKRSKGVRGRCGEGAVTHTDEK